MDPSSADTSPDSDSEVKAADPMAEAEREAAALATPVRPLGEPGPRFDRRSPFFIGLSAAAGVAVTYAVIEVLLAARGMLILIVVALFLAVGIEPMIVWLERRHFRRWIAVTVVLLGIAVMLALFLVAAITPLVEQGRQFASRAPELLTHIRDRYPIVSDLDEKYHLEEHLTTQLDGSGSALATGLLGAGRAVFSAVADAGIVAVLTTYFLIDYPRIRTNLYRLVPHSRRPRAIAIGDQILAGVGGYVLGNVLISVITAVCTFAWLLIFDVPYPLILALLVALLDLIPIVGSTIAGVVVALVSLTVSVPTALATVAFFIALRLLEDYLLVPKIIGKTVAVPALVTVVAVLLGGALLGIVGALLAIPVAAALLLLARRRSFRASTLLDRLLSDASRATPRTRIRLGAHPSRDGFSLGGDTEYRDFLATTVIQIDRVCDCGAIRDEIFHHRCTVR